MVSSSTGTGIAVSCATVRFRGGPVKIVNNAGNLAGAFKATEFARILFQVEVSARFSCCKPRPYLFGKEY